MKGRRSSDGTKQSAEATLTKMVNIDRFEEYYHLPSAAYRFFGKFTYAEVEPDLQVHSFLSGTLRILWPQDDVLSHGLMSITYHSHYYWPDLKRLAI